MKRHKKCGTYVPNTDFVGVVSKYLGTANLLLLHRVESLISQHTYFTKMHTYFTTHTFHKKTHIFHNTLTYFTTHTLHNTSIATIIECIKQCREQ